MDIGISNPCTGSMAKCSSQARTVTLLQLEEVDDRFLWHTSRESVKVQFTMHICQLRMSPEPSSSFGQSMDRLNFELGILLNTLKCKVCMTPTEAGSC